MSVVCVKPARTSFFLVALIILGHGRKSTGNDDAFECPVKCSTDVYRPICLRGKSYANLCVLKRDICSGKIARELYKDVEACPGYEKDEDANGASVEAIDKNGVIFRNFIDRPAKTVSSPPAADVPDTKSIDLSAKRRGSRLRGRHCERLERMRICRQTCSTGETYRRPVRVLGVYSRCCIKFLARGCCTPCRCRSCERSDNLEDVDSLVHVRPGNYRLSEVTSAPREGNDEKLVAARFVRKTCRIYCHPNEHPPIRTERHCFATSVMRKKLYAGDRSDDHNTIILVPWRLVN